MIIMSHRVKHGQAKHVHKRAVGHVSCVPVYPQDILVLTDCKIKQAEMLDPTILGTLNVLHSCAKSTTLKRVVLTSSTAAVRFRDDLEQPGAVTYLDEYSWSSIFFCTKYQVILSTCC